jgi:peptidoglycan/xylan/chitin deacetylase (PgdA/CDA1 family)
VPSASPFLRRLGLELAYHTGYAHLMRLRSGVAGVILRFERVRPRRIARFQPLASAEVTPEFLDRTISALQKWEFDIVSIDEVCRRAVTLAAPRRFVCLTFDGGYKDLIDWAYPVLSRRRVPFAAYVPTAHPDGVGEVWWLALEAVIANERHLSLMIDRKELHFTIEGTAEKYQLYDFLHRWMRSLSPSDLSTAIRDLCRRYSVDLGALSREAVMNWADLAQLAADPLVTIGTATVNYPVLARLKDDDALREITMGRAVAQSALGREVRHFAYPFGDRAAYRRRDVTLAAQAGFASAASAIPGAVSPAGQTSLHELPRLAWDGRLHSLRAMRVLLWDAMARRPERASAAAI